MPRNILPPCLCLLLLLPGCGRLRYDEIDGLDGRDGNDSTGPSFPEGGAITALSAGETHTCAVADGALYCWGSNLSGELGLGSNAPSAVTAPARVGGATDWIAVSAGAAFTCGLRAGGVLWCWGRNDVGQLGVASSGGFIAQPTLAAGGITWTAVGAGRKHACGIDRDDTAFCWGNNLNGELGSGDLGGFLDRPSSAELPQGWTGVTGGHNYTCGLLVASVYCWGANQEGQLGLDIVDPIQLPTPTALDLNAIASLSGGSEHVCAITATGRPFCWGDNRHGQLGLGDAAADRHVPVELEAELRSVAAGGFHTCGIGTDQQLYCWGSNELGQLGTGGSGGVLVEPNLVAGAGAQAWDMITAGGDHSCAAAGATALCWGDNQSGQLGLGDTAPRLSPTAIR